MIKVLVVEDSRVVQDFLVHILNSDAEISVVGTAETGEEAVEAVRRMKPDVITMDIHLPFMNGFDATRKIMEAEPTPIVVVSGSHNIKEAAMTFRALEAGALAVVQKPTGRDGAAATELVRTVKLMSEVKVVRRWPHRSKKPTVLSASACVTPTHPPVEIRLVAIGASTGGPIALKEILSKLTKPLSVPVLIVQHMAPGFTTAFTEWLAEACDLPIQVARNGDPIQRGHVYVAPDGTQMKIGLGQTIMLTKDAPENGLRPSVSYLFRSVSSTYKQKAVGVLLTGMGKDGAQELKMMKEAGAITIAQDKDSSVVHGMPGEAIRLDGANYVLGPESIAGMLTTLTATKAGIKS